MSRNPCRRQKNVRQRRADHQPYTAPAETGPSASHLPRRSGSAHTSALRAHRRPARQVPALCPTRHFRPRWMRIHPDIRSHRHALCERARALRIAAVPSHCTCAGTAASCQGRPAAPARRRADFSDRVHAQWRISPRARVRNHSCAGRKASPSYVPAGGLCLAACFIRSSSARFCAAFIGPFSPASCPQHRIAQQTSIGSSRAFCTAFETMRTVFYRSRRSASETMLETYWICSAVPAASAAARSTTGVRLGSAFACGRTSFSRSYGACAASKSISPSRVGRVLLSVRFGG